VEEMRGKVEASIDQPQRERQTTKGTAGTAMKGILGSNQATRWFPCHKFSLPPPMPMRGRRGINRS